MDELSAVQGKPVDIGGYYLPDAEKCKAVMRPSATFNAALAAAREQSTRRAPECRLQASRQASVRRDSGRHRRYWGSWT